jgi:hypothetical protein
MDESRPVARERQHQGAQRACRITLRFTNDEVADLKRRSVQAGTCELAPYLRQILLAGQPCPVAAPAQDSPARGFGGVLVLADRPAGAQRRTSCIFVHVNAAELAELERRRQLTGMREMGAYVRQAVLAQRPPPPVVPELNRVAWLELAERLATLQELASSLAALAGRPRGGLAPLVGRGRLEETLRVYLEASRALLVAIQALRRSLLGSDRGQR